jgi:hypothetical protein
VLHSSSRAHLVSPGPGLDYEAESFCSDLHAAAWLLKRAFLGAGGSATERANIAVVSKPVIALADLAGGPHGR